MSRKLTSDYCQVCTLFNKNKNLCLLNNRVVNPATDYCSKLTREAIHCELCNNITLKPIFTSDGEQWHSFCSKCIESLSSCNFCHNANICEFETNPDSMPKVVIQQQRNPMGYMQTQIRNPAREEKFCHNCRCWSTEYQSCNRQFNYCGNIDHKFKNDLIVEQHSSQ